MPVILISVDGCMKISKKNNLLDTNWPRSVCFQAFHGKKYLQSLLHIAIGALDSSRATNICMQLHHL